jgi:hypothetical protein
MKPIVLTKMNATVELPACYGGFTILAGPGRVHAEKRSFCGSRIRGHRMVRFSQSPDPNPIFLDGIAAMVISNYSPRRSEGVIFLSANAGWQIAHYRRRNRIGSRDAR